MALHYDEEAVCMIAKLKTGKCGLDDGIIRRWNK
jgi:hypothetical protein